MSEINSKSKEILNFRPNIHYVEPEQDLQEPNPVEDPVVRAEPSEALIDARDLAQKARAVRILAVATQAVIDFKSKNVRVKLDPLVDQQVIQAMRRQFPAAGEVIDYSHYKEAIQAIQDHGCAKASGLAPTPDEIDQARNDFLAGRPNIAGINDPDAELGGLRPELDERSRIIDPIDLAKFQVYLIILLLRYIWRKYIRDMIIPIPGAEAILPGEDWPPLPSDAQFPDFIPSTEGQ